MESRADDAKLAAFSEPPSVREGRCELISGCVCVWGGGGLSQGGMCMGRVYAGIGGGGGDVEGQVDGCIGTRGSGRVGRYGVAWRRGVTVVAHGSSLKAGLLKQELARLAR